MAVCTVSAMELVLWPWCLAPPVLKFWPLGFPSVAAKGYCLRPQKKPGGALRAFCFSAVGHVLSVAVSSGSKVSDKLEQSWGFMLFAQMTFYYMTN